ncbi:glycosyltransferase family 4 protein [Lacisediminihabitans profunda]|uniref:Glycosyltransferase family 4 protein n=1 Tax=Lacisediminihabitans profunda TaxID=2594790 RepID=A0A5C8UIU3_9MICO|nr:glycosyltransferase family 1 protein [Lacisediminihabitans profunda]TXN28255.1 glycosyltransferase family 4 protein [Lacisediminihabitans profunda]
MTTLRVIVDQIVAPIPGGIGRYTEELTRELIHTAPLGCEVTGVVSASPEQDYERITTLLPGLAGLFKSALARRELEVAWQFGLTRLPGSGMLHAPGLFAPLSKHDRLNNVGDQTVVTIHDVIPWTHPESLSPRRLAWYKAMTKRAYKYADAVVVPTHAVAMELAEIYDFGDRIRVIGGAVSSKLTTPIDPEARAERLALPDRYILSMGTLEPRNGLVPLIQSLSRPELDGIPLLIAGPEGFKGLDLTSIAAEAGLEEGRVRSLGYLADADLAVALGRAAVFVFPSLAEGFGLPVIEAFNFGTPVVHSDDAAVVEVAAGAGLVVARDDPEGYPDRLAAAISTVLTDQELASRLGFLGQDRAGAFSWKDSAEKVWQLHADL